MSSRKRTSIEFSSWVASIGIEFGVFWHLCHLIILVLCVDRLLASIIMNGMPINNSKMLSPANNRLIQTPHSCSGTVAQMYFRCAVRWFPGHCRHSATCPVYHGPANSSRNALRSEVSSHAIFRYQDSVWWLHRPAQGCLVISAFWQCWDFNLLQ